MAGSTPASPTAEAGAGRAAAAERHFSPGLEAWRRFRRHRLAVVSGAILLAIVLAILLGAVRCGTCRSTRSTSPPASRGRRGRIRSAPTISARTCWRACSTAGASRWPSASPRWSSPSSSAPSSARLPACRAAGVGSALMWLTDLFLSLPQLPLLLLVIYLFRDALKSAVRPRGRRLHPDRRRHRRLALDAGGAARARAVPVAAREGVRRGGARARRHARRARWCATSCPTRWGR